MHIVETMLKQRGQQLEKLYGSHDRNIERTSELAVDLAQLQMAKEKEEANLEALQK